ncbi:MAG: PEGA domain-containing protein, partial [Lachnospiraceae bacterium]|nr:PEGA domain-containing protein [Lachnospiraceae bacterium]
LLMICMLAGCGSSQKKSAEPGEDANLSQTESTAAAKGMTLADSLDQVILRQIDAGNKRLLCYSLKAKKSYLLVFDDATSILDKYGQQLVAEQLQSGDPVTVAFIKDEQKARGIFLDTGYERKDNITGYEINEAAHTMEFDKEQHSIERDALVLMGGRVAEFSDINACDELSVIEKDSKIAALVVTRGHGYVRLVGADSFEGGWVEFGSDLIRPVEKDALYVVPEGSYEMLISKGKDSGTKKIEVKGQEEVQVDVSDILTDADRTGQVFFTIQPAGAKLVIDEKQKDYSNAIELSYGIHQVEVSMEGYQTSTQYIKVGEPMASLSVTLEEAKSGENADDEGGSGSVSANTTVVSASADGEYKVYIDGPANAELYVDDIYVGIVPTSFAKQSGKHTVSLRREGYIPRSYTLQIDEGKNDNHYSFSSMKPSGATESGDLAQTAISSLLSNTLNGMQ